MRIMTVKDMVAYMAKGQQQKKLVELSLEEKENPSKEEESGAPISMQLICQKSSPGADPATSGVVEKRKLKATNKKDYGNKTRGDPKGAKAKKTKKSGVKEGLKACNQGALEKFLIREVINTQKDKGQTQSDNHRGTDDKFKKPEEGDTTRPPDGNH